MVYFVYISHKSTSNMISVRCEEEDTVDTLLRKAFEKFIAINLINTQDINVSDLFYRYFI